ncbi:antibiotic biosynthesis monooxygenase [Streptomyces sp. XM4193]|uniref:putative quinol monooxygenase n=1 Tax=Streptomyces sp. XM4193 TaxID=2929782 RepID=UPI001FFB57A3|nr:putative quinol monooxygenase [Streptomyces sp. XM4193]MCK1794728.1 antibiotic biosynthesis monooxygenase [Streptomyces sp. XM4193]
MSDAYGLVVRFELHDLTAATGFDQLVAQTRVGIEESEPGTLAYVVHEVPDEPNVRVFYELYASREAFEAHENQPHVQRFLRERGQYLADTRVTFLTSPSGKAPMLP